jgi:hypothetical protein
MDKKLTFFTGGAVAKRLQIPRAQLLYLIEKGDLPAPATHKAGKWLFTEEEAAALVLLLKHIDLRLSSPSARARDKFIEKHLKLYGMDNEI